MFFSTSKEGRNELCDNKKYKIQKRKFEKETNMYIDLEKQLKKEERRNQILLLIGFFIVLFIIGAIDEFIRHKFNKKN